jgi:hypothetical protein
VFLFPIARSSVDRFAGAQTFEGQSFQFVFRGLVRADETRHITGNGNSLRFGPFAEARLNCWVDVMVIIRLFLQSAHRYPLPTPWLQFTAGVRCSFGR